MGRMKNITGIVYLLLFAVLGMAGCGNRGNNVGEQPQAQPTVTPIMEVAVIPTFTPTVIPVIPEPTSTETPTLVPTPTPAPNRAKTSVQANLRAGPGVDYQILGVLNENSSVVPVARTADRQWLKLDTGAWIFADLVDEVPRDLAVEANIPAPPPPTATPTSPPPTEVPATGTPIPTSTPVPVLGHWSLPVHRNESYLMQDGLEITIREVIYGDDERMQSYIERRGGQSCAGCLAIELQIINKEGNSKEYITQEDFKLFNGGPDTEPYRQVRCQHADSLRSMVNQAGLRALVKGLNNGGERFACFEGVESLSLSTRLAYSPVFLYVNPNTPSPTPTPGGRKVVYATDPIEKEQSFRTGWSVYFILLGI